MPGFSVLLIRCEFIAREIGKIYTKIIGADAETDCRVYVHTFMDSE